MMVAGNDSLRAISIRYASICAFPIPYSPKGRRGCISVVGTSTLGPCTQIVPACRKCRTRPRTASTKCLALASVKQIMSMTISGRSSRIFRPKSLTLYRDGEVRAFHNLDADWGASFTLSTRHFLDVLAGREPEEALTAQAGRRVIALYDLFRQSNAERRAVAG